MNCPSALTHGEEGDHLLRDFTRVGTPVITLKAGPVESGPTERLGARARLAPQATFPEGLLNASSGTRLGEDTDAVNNHESAESVDGALVRIALTYLGVPYRWGGLTPGGFDCSGFVAYLHAKVGISIPHNVAAQYRYGAPVSKDRLKPGDLVFFDRLHHNGIYIGRGQFIHASKTGEGVRISSLDDPWYKSRWIGGRRIAGEA
jgi:cell wall-associated NlpC family hydrolase